MAFCTILSLGEGIPSGLILPFALGIHSLRTGLNLKLESFISLEICLNSSWDTPSSVSSSLPGVIFPGLDLISQ